MKLGRNDYCPCGSGKKVKRCHGIAGAGRATAVASALGELVREFQRERQQGLGRPILSDNAGQRTHVAVGGRLFDGPWHTFHDFLRSYLTNVVGADWLSRERDNDSLTQHPLARLATAVDEHIRTAAAKGPGGVIGVPSIGAMQALMMLAYDLYAVEHFGLRASDPKLYGELLRRLKLRDQFAGARFEFRVAAQLLRAGFRLKWLDEAGRGPRTCEYTCTHPKTRKTFSVECKIRQPQQGADPWANLGRIESLIAGALGKEAEFERLIFLDLNLPGLREGQEWDWQSFVRRRICRMEKNRQFAALPSATLFVSSFPELHHPDSEVPRTAVIAEGFKTGKFKWGTRQTLRHALDARAADPEVFGLLKSIEAHSRIPSSFDGHFLGTEGVPTIGTRLKLNGCEAVVEDAVVMGAEGLVYVVARTDKGRREIWSMPLTPQEIEAWQQCPETFFGDFRDNRKPKNTPIELYDALLPYHLELSREQLVAQMAGWPDQERLRNLPHGELATELVEAYVNHVFTDANRSLCVEHGLSEG